MGCFQLEQTTVSGHHHPRPPPPSFLWRGPASHTCSDTYGKLLGSHFQDIEDNGVVALAGIVAALALQRV